MSTSISLQQALDYNLYTELNDRVLFYDGEIVIDPSRAADFFQSDLSKVRVSKTTCELEAYNQFVEPNERLVEKTGFGDISLDWNLPPEFVNLDVDEYIESRFADTVVDEPATFTDDDTIVEYYRRTQDELARYRELGLYPILRAIIYTINTLRTHNKVWGVGRGSGVSSYVLYLIGVHDVDSVFFSLDYNDFLR